MFFLLIKEEKSYPPYTKHNSTLYTFTNTKSDICHIERLRFSWKCFSYAWKILSNRFLLEAISTKQKDNNEEILVEFLVFSQNIIFKAVKNISKFLVKCFDILCELWSFETYYFCGLN